MILQGYDVFIVHPEISNVFLLAIHEWKCGMGPHNETVSLEGLIYSILFQHITSNFLE